MARARRSASSGGGLRPDLLAALVRNLAAEGRVVELPVRGNSMRPALRDGDRVRVAPATRTSVRLGDVVLRVEPSGPAIHRCVGWWPLRDGWRVLTMGDGARRLDAPLPPGRLAGRIVARVRGREVRPFDGTWMKARGRCRAFRSLIVGLLAEGWDRTRGRARSDGI